MRKLSALMLFFYQNFPQHVQAMRECEHGGGELNFPNPYHFEGVWEHTLLVCKMLATKTEDTSILLAGILHDIGKPSCRFFDPVTGFVFFTGHETEGANIARPIIKKFEKEFSDVNPKLVRRLIRDHGDLYCLTPDQLVAKYNHDSDDFNTLVMFAQADCDGAYSTMGGVDMNVVNYVKERI